MATKGTSTLDLVEMQTLVLCGSCVLTTQPEQTNPRLLTIPSAEITLPVMTMHAVKQIEVALCRGLSGAEQSSSGR